MDQQQDQAAPPAEWVFLEVMGHRSHYGLLTEVERFGTKLARIDIFEGDAVEPSKTHLYGGPSIFSITPATERLCRERSKPYVYKPAALTYDEPEEDDGLPEFMED